MNLPFYHQPTEFRAFEQWQWHYSYYKLQGDPFVWLRFILWSLLSLSFSINQSRATGSECITILEIISYRKWQIRSTKYTNWLSPALSCGFATIISNWPFLVAPWQSGSEWIIDKRVSFSLINNVIFIYTWGKYGPRGRQTLRAEIDDIYI